MSATLLKYQFNPAQVFIATSTDLQLIITNPETKDTPITFAGGPKGDEINITFPVGSGDTDLVNTLDFTCTSKTSGFTCGLSSGNNFFAIKSPKGAVLEPGQTIVIVFSNVVINGQTGKPASEATIKIKEYIGTNTGDASVAIKKLPQELNIVAWLDPMVVGKKQYATLYWQSMGGTKVVIAGFGSGTGTKEFEVTGDPPHSDSCKVNVPSDTEGQRDYTLRVYTSDQKHVETKVTLTQLPPLITSFSTSIAEPGPITVAQKVEVSWTSLYATDTYLQLADGKSQKNPISPVTISPGEEIAGIYVPGTPLPGKACYKLTLMGFQKLPPKCFEFKLLPVELLYFKYATMDGEGKLSGVVFKTNADFWPSVFNPSNPEILTFSFPQPGLPNSVYYLGNGDTEHPQIQYFEATAKTAGEYELQWVTANLDALVLNPGNITIPAGDIPKGKMTVKDITLPATFTLTGTGKDKETINSILTIGGKESTGSTLTDGGAVRFAAKHIAEPVEPVKQQTALFDDPNCKVVITETGAIPNYYGTPSAQQRADATAAIAKLEFDDIWRLPPWRIKEDTVRLDVQGAIAGGGRNWQIQVNDIKGHSTIAAVTVQGNLATASTPARRAYVQRMVRAALVKSLTDEKSEDVNGPCT